MKEDRHIYIVWKDKTIQGSNIEKKTFLEQTVCTIKAVKSNGNTETFNSMLGGYDLFLV